MRKDKHDQELEAGERKLSDESLESIEGGADLGLSRDATVERKKKKKKDDVPPITSDPGSGITRPG